MSSLIIVGKCWASVLVTDPESDGNRSPCGPTFASKPTTDQGLPGRVMRHPAWHTATQTHTHTHTNPETSSMYRLSGRQTRDCEGLKKEWPSPVKSAWSHLEATWRDLWENERVMTDRPTDWEAADTVWSLKVKSGVNWWSIHSCNCCWTRERLMQLWHKRTCRNGGQLLRMLARVKLNVFPG